MIRCVKCGQQAPPFKEGREICVVCYKAFMGEPARRGRPTKTRAQRGAEEMELRVEAIARYSRTSSCGCCGENNPRLLTIVPRVGRPAHLFGVVPTPRVARRLREEGYPSGYRVRCFNCAIAPAFSADKICHPKEGTREEN